MRGALRMASTQTLVGGVVCPVGLVTLFVLILAQLQVAYPDRINPYL